MLRYASFFTGAMGLDLGLEEAGWDCVFANEFDPVACATIRLNRPGLKLDDGDVRNLAHGSVPEELDLIVGGPPCQAFSTAGKRLGLNDARGNVFIHFVEMALTFRPRVIAIENVRGLLSAPLVHRPHSQRGTDHPPLAVEETPGGAFRHILSLFGEHQYEVSFDLYDTADFGIPQRRRRIVLIASRVGKIPNLVPMKAREKTFRNAVKSLTGSQEHIPLRDKQIEFLKCLGPGQNWRDLSPSQQQRAMGKAFHCTGGRTGFYRRLAWDEPSPTLVTSPTMPATLLAHPIENRPLSVQEYARIQTFPDDWKFAGTTAQKYRQIGNAVPVKFGRAIGEHLASWLN